MKSIVIIIFLLASMIFIISGVSAYNLDTKSKPNRVFLILCFLYAWWSAAFGLMVSAPTTLLASVYNSYAVPAINLSYGFLLVFILLITKNQHLINKKWKITGLFIPSILCTIFYSAVNQPPENFSMTPFGWTKVNNIDMGFAFIWSFKIYCGIYLIASILFLLNWRRTTKLQREKRQATVILPSVIFVGIIGVFIDLVLPLLGIPLIPPVSIILMTLPILTINFVISKYNLLSLSPQNLALEYIEIMNEGLVILDEKDRIVNLNSGFLQLLQYSKENIIGECISIILSDTAILSNSGQKFEIETNLKTAQNKIIPVLLSYSVLYDQFKQKTGTVMIIQNITELKRYQNELKSKVDELNREIIIRKDAEKRIAHMAYYDQLTDLPNRRLFFNKLEQATQVNESFAVFYMDLDLFKNVNDTLGHLAGDELLKQVAERLMTLSEDLVTIARIGGDEFLVLTRTMTDQTEAESIAARVLNVFANPFSVFGKQIRMTASIGISLYPYDSTDSSDLIKLADISLYRAKDQGKNKYLRYT